MSKINSSELLQQAKSDTNQIIEIVKNEFQILEEEQLTWKSAPDKWNVLQCLEHLNLTSQYYIPQMQAAIRQAIAAGQSPTTNFKRGFIGNKMTTGMKPKMDGTIPNRTRTFKNYNPNNLRSSQNTQVVFEAFLKHHQDFLDLIEEASKVNLNKVKVKSLLGSILKFKLGDAIEFLIAHEKRHIVQAQNVLKNQFGG